MATNGRHVLTREEAERGLRNGLWNPERRARQKLTRTWYKNTILAIAKGEQNCNGVQWKALYEYAEMMGWHGRRVKKPKAKPLEQRPEINEDLAARLGLA